jgi:hypothetical protein
MRQGWLKQMTSDTFGPVHIMQKSKIVEIDGVFIGVAVLLSEAQGWRFVAADDRAAGADGCVAPTLNGAQQLAKKAFFSARSPAASVMPSITDAAANAWPLRASA